MGFSRNDTYNVSKTVDAPQTSPKSYLCGLKYKFQGDLKDLQTVHCDYQDQQTVTPVVESTGSTPDEVICTPTYQMDGMQVGYEATGSDMLAIKENNVYYEQSSYENGTATLDGSECYFKTGKVNGHWYQFTTNGAVLLKKFVLQKGPDEIGHAIGSIKLKYKKPNKRQYEYYQNSAGSELLNTGQTLQTPIDEKIEITLDTPVFTDKFVIELYNHETASGVNNNTCIRFDAVVQPLQITYLNIHCKRLNGTSPQLDEWKSTGTPSTYLTTFNSHRTKWANSLQALVSDTQSGIGSILLGFDFKDDCGIQLSQIYEKTLGIPGNTGTYTFDPNELFPGYLDDLATGLHCTTKIEYFRWDCVTNIEGLQDVYTPSDEGTLDIDTGKLTVDTDFVNATNRNHTTRTYCVRAVLHSKFWEHAKKQLGFKYSFRACSDYYTSSDFDVNQADSYTYNLARNQEDRYGLPNFTIYQDGPSDTTCTFQKVALYHNNSGTIELSDTVSYDNVTQELVFSGFSNATTTEQVYYIVALTVGDKWQDFKKISIFVCGSEVFAQNSTAHVLKYNYAQTYDQATGRFNLSQLFKFGTTSKNECYYDPWSTLDNIKMCENEDCSTLYQNTTELELQSIPNPQDFGLFLDVYYHQFWSKNFTVYLKFTSKGDVSVTRQVDIEMGPNCYVVVYSAEPKNANSSFPVNTLQMVLELVNDPELGIVRNYPISIPEQVTIKPDQELCVQPEVSLRYYSVSPQPSSSHALIYYNTSPLTYQTYFNGQTNVCCNWRSLATTVTTDNLSNEQMTADQGIFSNPFLVDDFETDARLDRGLQVKVQGQTGQVTEALMRIKNDYKIQQDIKINILVCGAAIISKTTNYTNNFTDPEGYVKVFNLHEQHLDFAMVDQFVINLSDFFEPTENEGYRTAMAFIDEFATFCSTPYPMLCLDALCATQYNHTELGYAQLLHVNGDDSWQLVIDTSAPLTGTQFHLRIYNKGLQELVIPFDIYICGAEEVIPVGGAALNTTTIVEVNSTNLNSTLNLALWDLFGNDASVQCPVTEITISYELAEVDNTLLFSYSQDLGEVLTQSVAAQEILFEQMFAFTNTTAEEAKLQVDTSLLNDTSPLNFTVNITAKTDSAVTTFKILEFNFTKALVDPLNKLPIANENITDWLLDIDFSIIPENVIRTFSFNDSNKHLMTIITLGNETIESFATFTELVQVGETKNYTIELDLKNVKTEAIGTHALVLQVCDRFNCSEFPFNLVFTDITPPWSFPETAPQFSGPLETIELAFEYTRPSPIELVEYVMPDAFDMNGDEFTISIIEDEAFGRWSYFWTFDGQSKVTVDCNLITDADVDKLMSKEELEFALVIEDSKGYKTEDTLKFKFDIEVISTFKGVVIEEVDQKVEEEEVIEEVVEEVVDGDLEEVNPDLIAQITDITTLGKVTLQFGEGFFPPGSSIDDIQDKTDQMLELAIALGPYEIPDKFDYSKLDFIWEIETFDKSTGVMEIQVNFTNAVYISANTIPDYLEITLIDYYQFVGDSRRRRRALQDAQSTNHSMQAVVARQMPNNEATQTYDKGTEQMSFLMLLTTIYTLLLSMVLANAVKKLLVTLLALQVIIHMFMYTVPFPGNIVNVIKKIKPIVSFNLMKTLSKYTENFFQFDKVGQLALKEKIIPNAKSLGVGHMNCIVNLKNIFQLISIYYFEAAFALFLRVVIILTGKCIARYKKLSYQLFFPGLIQIVQAGFIPITIACFLQISYPLETTFGEKLGYRFALMTAFLSFIVYPLFMVGVIFASKETLLNPEIKARFGPIYNGHKINTPCQRAFRLIFILRRWAVLYIVFFLSEEPFYQIIAMNLMNVFIMIYHGLTEPFATRFARRIDLFNEMCVTTITYFMFMYNDNVPDEELKFVIGWAQVGVFGFMILVNIFDVLKKMAKDSWLLTVKRYRLLRQKLQKRQQERLEKIQTVDEGEVLMPPEVPKPITVKHPKKPKAAPPARLQLTIITEEELEESRIESARHESPFVKLTFQNAYRRGGGGLQPTTLHSFKVKDELSFRKPKRPRLKPAAQAPTPSVASAPALAPSPAEAPTPQPQGSTQIGSQLSGPTKDSEIEDLEKQLDELEVQQLEKEVEELQKQLDQQ